MKTVGFANPRDLIYYLCCKFRIQNNKNDDCHIDSAPTCG